MWMIGWCSWIRSSKKMKKLLDELRRTFHIKIFRFLPIMEDWLWEVKAKFFIRLEYERNVGLRRGCWVGITGAGLYGTKSNSKSTSYWNYSRFKKSYIWVKQKIYHRTLEKISINYYSLNTCCSSPKVIMQVTKKILYLKI